jgi:hypothetical protein
MRARAAVGESGTDIGQTQGSSGFPACVPQHAADRSRLSRHRIRHRGHPHAEGNDWAFISSGTWSLVGCVLGSACVSEAARRARTSATKAEWAAEIYFLKNVNGMWLLRQCIEHWKSQGHVWTVEQLVEACARFDAPESVIDVDDPELLLPGDMPGRINAQLERMGQPSIPDSPNMAARMTNLILHSLAARYAAVLQNAVSITGKALKRLYIVGGGSKNAVLNRLTGKGNRASGLDRVNRERNRGQSCDPTRATGWKLHARNRSHRGRRGKVGQRFISARPVVTLEIEASGNTLAPNTVKEVQRPTGKALA